MVSTLLASVGALLFPLLALAGWWVCFLAPLGRRTFRASIVIAASPDAVWRLLDPRADPGEWSPISEVRGRRIVAEAPLTVAFESRRRDGGGDYQQVVTTYPVVEPGRRLVQCVRSRAGRTIPENRLHVETVDLAANPRGVRVTLSAVTPVHGLIAYELTRLSVGRALAALERAALGRPRRSTPRIRFAGWRLLAVGTGTACGILLGFPMVSTGGWIGLTISLAIPLTLTLAVLAHEFGHAFAFVAFGHRGVTISLVPFFGGATWSRRRYESAYESGMVALAGAAFSAALCLPLLPALGAFEGFLASMLQDFSPAAVAARAGWLPKVELGAGAVSFLLIGWQAMLNALNLLPLPGLDGARALEAIVADRRVRLLGAACCLAIFTLMTGSPRATLEIALFTAILRLPVILRRSPPPPALAPPTPRQRLILVAAFALTLLCVGYEAQRVLSFVNGSLATIAHAGHAAAPGNQDGGDPDADDARPTPIDAWDRGSRAAAGSPRRS